MKRLSLATLIVIASFAGNGISASGGQTNDWITVQPCKLSLQIPLTLKRNRLNGIDSCVVEFEDREMLLSIDYGTWGGAAKKDEVTFNFAEKSFVVNGKTGVLATYVDNSLYARNHPERKYVAHLFVIFKAAEGPYGRPTSLMATVRGRSVKDLDIAQRIFESVRFLGTTPNNALDRSGGSVFRIIIGPAKSA